MGTIADLAELLIGVGLFILAIIAVDRFWMLVEFLGKLVADVIAWLERRRTLRFDKPRNRVVLVCPFTRPQLQQIAGRMKRGN